MFTAGVNYCWPMALLHSRQRSQDLLKLHVLTSMGKVIVKYTAARSRQDFSASLAQKIRELEKKLGRKSLCINLIAIDPIKLEICLTITT